MPKQLTSTLTTDQLIGLAHKILNNADGRHVDYLMRAHTSGSTPHWNRQELIAFLAARNGGTEPDTIVQNMTDAALRQKQTETKQMQKTDGFVVNVIDGGGRLNVGGSQNKSAEQAPNTLFRVLCIC